MADGFEVMVDAAQAFFAQLAQNNSRAWFEPHKAHYKDAIESPARFFADLVAEDLARLTGVAHAPKVFRIYRDVRFSKDKTPLKTHLHLMWSPAGRTALSPVWFWGVSPDYFILGMGVTGLKGEDLARYRGFVEAHGAGFQAALQEAAGAAGAQISDWGPEPLKKVPKPYAADHPQADLLRRKALAVTVPMGADWRARGVLARCVDRIEVLLPLWRQFDRHL